MHPSLSSRILKAFNNEAVCFFTISVVFMGITLADKLAPSSSSSLPSFKARNQWSLRHSNPTGDGGRFLNVPIYYGDWVPIDTAKAQIESFASAVESGSSDNRRKDDHLVISSPALITDDLTSPVRPSPSITFTEQDTHNIKQQHHHHQIPQVNDAEDRVEVNHVPPYFIGPRLPSHRNHHKETNIWHNPVSRPFNRLRPYYRSGGGVGGNSRRKYRPTNSDALTRLFGPNLGSVINGKRRHHRKITQTHHSQSKPSSSVPLVDQISSIFGAAPTQDTTGLQTTASTGSSSALETLGNVFNLLSPSLPNLKGSSRPDGHHYVSHQTSESINQPVIKLLSPPDLTQDESLPNNSDDVRSSIYEDNGKGVGEIIVGRRPGQNEIGGFVPVSGSQTIYYPGSQYQKPSNFSVLISGISKHIDTQTLAKLFKEGRITEKGDHKAFIGSPDVSAPQGFHKITLPFMDPSETVFDTSKLPSIFIAPLGYKAPKGYKGHPLPFDPAPTDPFYSSSNKGKINLVHTTEPSASTDVVEHENEIKTTRFKNPFLRNKLRNQRLPYRPNKTISTTETPEILVSGGKSDYTTDRTQSSSQEPLNFVRSKIKFGRNRFKNQRKRVLTKIVRKPYNPSITTPSPTSETKKIVRIIDPTSVSFKIEEYFPPTSGRPILNRNDKIDLVVDQVYNTTAVIPSLGISTTFRPIQIKYLDIQSTNVPKLKEINSETTERDVKLDSYEEEHVQVTHFEPTTTHDNLIFETTQPTDQTTKNLVENDNNELYDDDEITTVPPTSFVTRKSFTPKVTNRPTTKLINFVPYSPAATTRTTTSSTTTTSKIVTDSYSSYEPTPFNFNLDPIARLERLNHLKNRKYGKSRPSILDKEEESEYIVPTVRPTTNKLSDQVSYKLHNNRIKYRKYGYNQGKDDGRIFGQRIKERKRPTLWDSGYRDDYYATTIEPIETTTLKKAKSDDYKRKFRPFFDQLYEQLTNDKGSDTEKPEGNNRRISVFGVRRKIRPYNGWRKKSRSTTTPNPFTINAEIYEVHPESRARITTTETSPPSPTFEVVTESSTQYEDYLNEFKSDHLSNIDGTQSSEEIEPITDLQSYYNSEDVHETADKHSPVPTEHVIVENPYDKQNSQSSSILISLQGQTKFRPSWLNKNELSHNGLVESNVPLEFGESQFVENSLNEIVATTPEGSAAPVTRLLDQYQKTFAPSTKIANKHDSDYQQPHGIINEHSQQQLTVKEGDFIPFHNTREGDNWEQRPLIPYVEIQRSRQDQDKSPVSISVQTVPTDDTSLIQEVLDEVYNFTVPSDPGLPQNLKTLDSLNEVYHKPLPDYSTDSSETDEYEDELTNTEVTATTEDEAVITTTLGAVEETFHGEVSTTESHLEPESNEGTETTASFFVTPTTRRTVSHHEEILSDPQPTIQEDTLIIDGGDLEESTTTLAPTLKDETTPEFIEDIIELTEEATPEISDNHHNNKSEEDKTVTTTILSSPTIITTTDNFEITTFRPKGKGGFFDNFNLATLLSYIVPKRTTTTTPPRTTNYPTTLKQESIPTTTNVFTTGVTNLQSETATENAGVKSTRVVQTISDFVSTDSPITTSLEEAEEHNTILPNQYDEVITTSPSTVYFTVTTKTSVPTELSMQEETTSQNVLNVTHATYETTTLQDEVDTTTDLIFNTIISRTRGVTEYDVEDEQDTTTLANYITDSETTSRVRTERPFRGPLRLHKTFKKNGNRYQRKNKKKKVGSGLTKKNEDKNGGIISKAVYGAIKREEYIKNWVARKYNKFEKNSKKRLFSLNATYQPQTTIVPSQETEPEATTTESQTSLPSSPTTLANKNVALPFAPTALPPKNKLFNVDLDVTVRDGNSSSSVGNTSSLLAASSVKSVISEKRKTFLDKLKSSARKSLSDNLFAKNVKNGKSSETSSSNISLPTHKSSKKISWVYPRGSDTKVFKKWGGDSISQAEFERKVLGVSTATEVSVKSMICVRGRCYNADEAELGK